MVIFFVVSNFSTEISTMRERLKLTYLEKLHFKIIIKRQADLVNN